jgi:DNA-directed RNA polymerase subunit RPC12/RpoP
VAIEILAVEWNWTNSKALTGGRDPRPPIKDSPRAISARCGECQTEFNATRSWNAAEPGMFFLLPMGDASLKCPNCGHETVEHYAAF